ncbi:MAG TPA: GNAT family N-acetyltransferase [Pirellulales bacterium]|nr:GNAT family N-acetyltransferase [Pirellulales bacterium]
MPWQPPPLDVVPAISAAEVRSACDIMLEAADWLVACGQPLWDREAVAAANAVPQPGEGLLFLAHLAGRPVGTYVLLFEDPLYWPDVGTGKSHYVHKLAIRRSVAGTGVGRGLLTHAIATARAAGRPFLRLDCAPRPKLCAFYESAGFSYHSRRDVGSFLVCRYEIVTGAVR